MITNSLFSHLSNGLRLKAMKLEETAKEMRQTLKKLQGFSVSINQDEDAVGGLSEGWGTTLIRSEDTFFAALALNGYVYKQIPIIQKSASGSHEDIEAPQINFESVDPSFPVKQVRQLLGSGWEVVVAEASGGWKRISDEEWAWHTHGILMKKMPGEKYDPMSFRFI